MIPVKKKRGGRRWFTFNYREPVNNLLLKKFINILKIITEKS